MSRLPLIRRRTVIRLVPALLVLSLMGCGSGLNRMSGKVTFGGKPIPAGKIYFIPDGAKGNSGPSGYADIKDGAYDTSGEGGKGVGKGPMIVAIEGNDPAAPVTDKNIPAGENVVKSLFPRYETSVELNGEATKDFDVPADAAKRKPGTGGAIIP